MHDSITSMVVPELLLIILLVFFLVQLIYYEGPVDIIISPSEREGGTGQGKARQPSQGFFATLL